MLENHPKPDEKAEREVNIEGSPNDLPEMILSSYRFDSASVLKDFPIEIIYTILDYLYICTPIIEFEYSQNTSIKHEKYHRGRKLPYSIESDNRGWGRTGKISKYYGFLTLEFLQPVESFWTSIGIKSIDSASFWTVGVEFGSANFDCLFYYRMDEGRIHSFNDESELWELEEKLKNDFSSHEDLGEIVFPRIYRESIGTINTLITLYFVPGKLNIVRCNRFELTNEQRDKSYNIPTDFYLYTDIYYRGTVATIYCHDGEELYKKYYSEKEEMNMKHVNPK